MYNLKTNTKKFSKLLAKDTNVGDLMVINEGNHCEGHILLHCYDRLISLTDPQKAWFIDVPLEVTLLKSGESITLTVE